MNEAIFFFHILLIVAFSIYAVKKSKVFLSSLFILYMIFANLFILKEVNLFGFSVTATDPYGVGAHFCLGFLQLYYGKEAARSCARWLVYMMVLFVACSYLQIAYIPSSTDSWHDVYVKLLTPSWRIVLSSLVVAYLSMQLGIFVREKLKKTFKTSSNTFTLSTVPVIIAQAFDTISFTFLALSGIMSNLWHIVAISFTMKIIAIALFAPVSSLIDKYKLAPRVS